MFGLGTTELIIILAIILLIFGAKKLPELARTLGKSAKEVRKGFEEDKDTTSATTEKKSST